MRKNNNHSNNILRMFVARLLERLKGVDRKEKEKLEIEILNSNTDLSNVEDVYKVVEQALARLDTRVRTNKAVRQQAKNLHDRARAINDMFS